MSAQNRINWRSILLTGIISGTIAIATGMLLYQLQERQPRLQYSMDETLPMDAGRETHAIYHVTIRNTGGSVVRDVVAQMNFDPGTVLQSRARCSPAVACTEAMAAGGYTARIPSLNPSESVLISALVRGVTRLPTTPAVTLRGDGITGERVSSSDAELSAKELLGSMIPAVAVALLTPILLVRIWCAKPGPAVGDDQREVFAYVLGLHGFQIEADRVLSSEKLTYWVQSDRLTSRVLAAQAEAPIRRMQFVLKGVLAYADHMAASSKGIVHYNMARLAKAVGDDATVEYELANANALIPDLLLRRLKLDPLFGGPASLT